MQELHELHYLSTAKLAEFQRTLPRTGTGRAVEAEASMLGASARLSVGGRAADDLPDAPTLEEVVAHIREKTWAHNKVPDSCESLMTRDWMEFTGRFRFGRGLSDVGLRDCGVYAYVSIEDEPCRQQSGAPCSGVEVILCGSIQHVLEHRDARATRTGSGSDWLHDLAAELVEREARGDTSFPDRLASTRFSDQEFAARSCYSMLSWYLDGPAYLHGFARVLCNFPPDQWQHRMIVATPLFVETGTRPTPTASVSQRALPSRWWQRWRPRR
ncbi:SAVMC3_10250 family protein [Kitasatospora sp. NPDC001119]